MRRNKVWKCCAPGSETASIPLKNLEGVMGEEEAGDVERPPGVRGGGERVQEENAKWAESG